MLIIYLIISIIVYEIRNYYIKMRYMYKDWYVCMYVYMYVYKFMVYDYVFNSVILFI